MSATISGKMPPTMAIVAEGVDHARHCAAALAAEQRRAIRKPVFEIVRDRPGIDDGLVIMQEHRDLLRAVRRDRALLGEAPGQ
ncbi:uncharacterized protein (DUF2461 family) [Bradyrhizobium diazoefficiens]